MSDGFTKGTLGAMLLTAGKPSSDMAQTALSMLTGKHAGSSGRLNVASASAATAQAQSEERLMLPDVGGNSRPKKRPALTQDTSCVTLSPASSKYAEADQKRTKAARLFEKLNSGRVPESQQDNIRARAEEFQQQASELDAEGAAIDMEE